MRFRRWAILLVLLSSTPFAESGEAGATVGGVFFPYEVDGAVVALEAPKAKHECSCWRVFGAFVGGTAGFFGYAPYALTESRIGVSDGQRLAEWSAVRGKRDPRLLDREEVRSALTGASNVFDFRCGWRLDGGPGHVPSQLLSLNGERGGAEMKGALLFMMLFGREIADEKAYHERMRDIDHSFAVLRKHSEMRSSSEVDEEARKLAALFKEVETFWKGRGSDEFAGFARMAKEGAKKAEEAAKKQDRKALQASIDSVARSCEGCHREPLDKYRIPKK
jgi:hypothetical protein